MTPVKIDGLPLDAPELVLPKMLDAYRLEREKRLKDETRSKQAAGALVIGGCRNVCCHPSKLSRKHSRCIAGAWNAR